jgi:hypothetical protein
MSLTVMPTDSTEVAAVAEIALNATTSSVATVRRVIARSQWLQLGAMTPVVLSHDRQRRQLQLHAQAIQENGS